jgi:GMP synthase-like glutamine amidotransferase
MLHLLILQHHPAEGPGAIHDWALQYQHQITLFLVPEGTALPVADTFDAVIILGGPWCIFSDDLPSWLTLEKEWLSYILNKEKPVFAICMGAQLLANALGADVAKIAAAETGWHAVKNQDTHEAITVLQWHEDGFSLPHGTELLMSGDQQAVQAFRSSNGQRVGLQFHAEWNQTIVDALHGAFGQECPLPKTLDSQLVSPMHQWLFRELNRWNDAITKLNNGKQI